MVRIFEECQVNYLAILPGSGKTVVYTNLYVVQINVISILVWNFQIGNPETGSLLVSDSLYYYIVELYLPFKFHDVADYGHVPTSDQFLVNNYYLCLLQVKNIAPVYLLLLVCF